jgi:hypothetical protein
MKPLEPILKELATGMLEMAEVKPNYSNDALIDAMLIFQSVFIDKIFDNQNYDNMPFKQRCEMATKAGEDFRKLIHTYTGLDTHELVNNYETKGREKTDA